jgi:hypothetical protein
MYITGTLDSTSSKSIDMQFLYYHGPCAWSICHHRDLRMSYAKLVPPTCSSDLRVDEEEIELGATTDQSTFEEHICLFYHGA